MIRLLRLEPILIANIAKAALAVGAAWGLAVTDAQGEAIVGIILALVVALAAFTKKERDNVTPVSKVAEILHKPVEVVDDVLKHTLP